MASELLHPPMEEGIHNTADSFWSKTKFKDLSRIHATIFSRNILIHRQIISNLEDLQTSRDAGAYERNDFGRF